MRLLTICVTGLLAVSPTACTVVAPQASVSIHDCTSLSVEDVTKPTRNAFLREVLFSAPTPRTRLFDDYTEGSYHIDKLDLSRGLASAAAACGVQLLGLVVIGPIGPLWSYHVISLQQEGDLVRANTLVMPHARITAKATIVMGRGETLRWLSDVVSAGAVTRGPPVWSGDFLSGDSLTLLTREFSFGILVASWLESQVELWHGWIDQVSVDIDVKAVDRTLEIVNGLLGTTRRTY